MDPVTLALIGGGGLLGLIKGIGKKKQEEKDRGIAAETTRWSPWTGLKGQVPEHTDVLGSTLGGALQGGMFGQSLGAAGASKGLMSMSDPTFTLPGSNAMIPQPDPQTGWLDWRASAYGR